jgi:thermostable 8-oxoguanine DNA glycosylase
MKIDYGFKLKTHFLQETGHFNLAHICSSIEDSLQKRNIRHVKIYCKDDYVISERTEDKEFNRIDFHQG